MFCGCLMFLRIVFYSLFHLESANFFIGFENICGKEFSY